MNSLLYDNAAEFDSFPVITTTNKYGTTVFQPKTREEYEIYLRESDENHKKTAEAVCILYLLFIIFTCGLVYILYYLFKLTKIPFRYAQGLS